jgi:hypothetical protein
LTASTRRGLEFARAGLAGLDTGSAAVRLHSLQAVACSKLGLGDQAQSALTAATAPGTPLVTTKSMT